MKRSVVALLAMAIAACAKAPPKPTIASPSATAESAIPPSSIGARGSKAGSVSGKAITANRKVALAELVHNSATYQGQTVVTEGTVKRVCQSMGCWMEIVDDQSQAHVKFANHAFFVPKDCHGKQARIEGRVLANEAAADDCHADGCRKGNPVDEGLAQVEFEATGVELN